MLREVLAWQIVSRHLEEHRANGDPYSMPLRCNQCGRDYQNPYHINPYHYYYYYYYYH